MIPDELRYTDKHEWVSAPVPSAQGSAVKVGITDFAQDALGDIVYVDLPEPGTAVTAGGVFGEVESTKSASEVYSPISGTVLARNDALKDHPELINADPYGEGWLIEIEPAAGEEPELLDAAGYGALIEQG